jgi:phosphonoacetaldehyde hydrolase
MEPVPATTLKDQKPTLETLRGLVPEMHLAIFDMGGTAVDFGCMAPLAAFVEAFRRSGVIVTNEQARGPMGTHKRDHIRALFKLPEIAAQWEAKQGKAWSEDDVQSLYDGFIPLQTEIAVHHADLIPGLIETVAILRENGIQIAATTGFPRAVAAPILETIAQAGFLPDFSICADEVPAGRPAPWMIFRSMEALGVDSVKSVVKVGDTVPDMQAARNAGVFAVGVTESGSEVGLPLAELEYLSKEVRKEKHETAAKKLFRAGAHAVIPSVAQFRPDTLWRRFLVSR